MDETLAQLRDRYPRVAPQLLAPFLEVLIAARAACGGDMDAFLILLSVALRMVEHEAFAQLSYEDILSGAHAELPGYGTNVRSIADSTGIARETVRRKVEALEQRGLVVRRDAQLFCTPKTFLGFAPVRQALLKLAMRNHRTIEALG